MRSPVGVLLVVLTGYAGVSAQVPSTPAPAFEVASVERNRSGRVGGAKSVPPTGAVTFTNVPVRMLIRDAYELDAVTERFTLVAGPYVDIIGSPASGPQPDVPRFDVYGLPPAGMAPRDRRAMMRTLLEDRFGLRVHRETRSSPCMRWRSRRRAASGQISRHPQWTASRIWRVAAPATRSMPTATCGVLPGGVGVSRSRVEIAGAGPVSLLRQRLQPYVDRLIVDDTGLLESVEWVLAFAWGSDVRADLPDVFRALEEQLGLRLDAREATVEVLVIDSSAAGRLRGGTVSDGWRRSGAGTRFGTANDHRVTRLGRPPRARSSGQ